jgi:hypothetical protein
MRAVIGGWSRYPEEIATARGQVGGTVFGIGAGLGLAGVFVPGALVLMTLGAVLIMRAWSKAEGHRDSSTTASHGREG